MDKSGLTEYLQSLGPPTGIQEPLWQKRVDHAVEVGFAMFWGHYKWSFRRKKDTITTVANETYQELPKDFGLALSVTVQSSLASTKITILGEEQFDEEFPYPADHSTGKPSHAKIVRGDGNLARIYWNRKPDAAYTIPFPYLKEAGEGEIGNLPSWALPAMVQCCMYYAGVATGNQNSTPLAETLAMLNAAVVADGTNAAVAGKIGVDEDITQWNNYGGKNSTGVTGDGKTICG